MGVFDSLAQGVRLGEQLGGDERNARAYRSGGMDAVREQAFRTGDLQTGMAARQFQDQNTQRAYERMQQIGPWAQNLVRAATSMAAQDPARARQWLQGQSQRFRDFGFSDDQINAGIAGLTDPDPATRQQWAQTLNQAFSQHKDPNWSIRGNQVVGVDPETGAVSQGGTLPEGATVQFWTPEQVAAAHLPPGTSVYTDPSTGKPVVAVQPHYSSGHPYEVPDDLEPY